jgi:hypothetical protein
MDVRLRWDLRGDAGRDVDGRSVEGAGEDDGFVLPRTDVALYRPETRRRGLG